MKPSRFPLAPCVFSWMAVTCLRADPGPVAQWSFDEANTRTRVGGYHRFVDGVRGQALRLDGYTTAVRRPAADAPSLDGEFTVEAWVALQATPWNWTAIFNQAGRRLEPTEPPAPSSGRNPGLIGAIYGEPDLSDPRSK